MVSDNETAADSDRTSSYSLAGSSSDNDNSGDEDNHLSDSGGMALTEVVVLLAMRTATVAVVMVAAPTWAVTVHGIFPPHSNMIQRAGTWYKCRQRLTVTCSQQSKNPGCRCHRR